MVSCLSDSESIFFSVGSSLVYSAVKTELSYVEGFGLSVFNKEEIIYRETVIGRSIFTSKDSIPNIFFL